MMNKHLLLLLLSALLAACQSSGKDSPPLAGASMGGPFALTDQNGQPVRDTDFAGRYRLVYFGYAFCPDVCPVDLQRLMQGFSELEKQAPKTAANVQPLFITVDPARDTPDVLKQFTSAFHPRLIGLTGTPAQIADVAKRYRVFFEAQPKETGGGYKVDHSRMTVLYGPSGEPLARIPEGGTPQEIAREIRRWAE